jgi:FkbM family methyltransferase
VSDQLRSLLAHAALRLWPFQFGIGTIMGLIRPPVPTQPLVTGRLRGFPLRFRFNPAPVHGRLLYYRGLAEERLILRLRRLLKPGMTFIDVGANEGLYSVIAAHCVGPSGRVLAFEPQQSLAERFWENVTMNRLGNVIREPVALGSTPGVSKLFQTSRRDMHATLRLRPDERSVGPDVMVTVRTLSDVLREHGVASVDGMKIDVEGGEIEVLEGFDHWMKAAPPRFIFVECIDVHLARFGHRSRDLISFLQERGYALYQPLQAGWAPVVMEAPPLRTDLLALHTGVGARS